MSFFVAMSVILGLVAAAAAGGTTYKALKERKLGEDKKLPELAGVGAAVVTGALVYTFWWAILIAGGVGGYFYYRSQKALKKGKEPKGALSASD